MKTYSYQIRFTTPAFLGNADQSAQWRTPPIKALLRQWWRVAVAHELGYDVDRLRERESELFGVAADGGDSHQSLIRIRLSQWNPGQIKSWTPLSKVNHPEVGSPVGSDLYLGYGPLTYAGGGTTIKKPPAIGSGENAILSLAFAPRRSMDADVQRQHERDIETALWLMDLYGTLGGRNRNGWGSLSLTPDGTDTAALAGKLDSRLTQPWEKALQRDWPHAIGTDTKGALVWQTTTFGDWKELVQALARIKIALRTQFQFTSGGNNPAATPEARHWLSYPVTHHNVKSWGGNARLPNSLRFKARPAQGKPGHVVGVIFHVPCLPPPAFDPNLKSIEHVWQTVHAFLDQPEQKLTRISA